MDIVTFPFSYSAFGVTTMGAPIESVTRTITSLQPKELLVHIHNASINPMDAKLQHDNFFHLPMPLPLGFDFSGTVVAVGEEGNNAEIRVGDEVFGFSTVGGCYAEYVKVNRDCVAKSGVIPAREAAAYGIAYNTAYESLFMKDDITKRKGQTIYIAGGAGGVGHFAVQLAKAYGLTVITTSSKPESIQLLKSLGADHVVNYAKHEVVQEILSLTKGVGVDLVYDLTYSTSSFNQSSQVVAAKGRWMRLGHWGRVADDTEARATVTSRGAEAVFGNFGRYWFEEAYLPKLGKFADVMADAVKLYEQKKVRPHISVVVAFEAKALQEAIDASGQGKLSTGKAVIQVGK